MLTSACANALLSLMPIPTLLPLCLVAVILLRSLLCGLVTIKKWHC
jgi:hypothetical protein